MDWGEVLIEVFVMPVWWLTRLNGGCWGETSSQNLNQSEKAMNSIHTNAMWANVLQAPGVSEDKHSYEVFRIILF